MAAPTARQSSQLDLQLVALRIYDVPRETVTDFWSAIEPMLAKALKRHPYLTMGGLLWMLTSNMAALILMTDGGKIVGACVMTRDAYPDEGGAPYYVGNVLAFAGEYGVFHKYIDEIQAHCETWARARGCATIGFVGRPGWTRFVLRKGGHLLPLVHAWRQLGG